MSETLGRNVNLYTAAQALGAATPPIIISLGGLVSMSMGAPHELMTLPVFLFNLGLALSTLPAAFLMAKLGRKSAYIIAGFMALISATLSASGIITQTFALFCAGTLLAGYYAAHVQSFRFAVVGVAQRGGAQSDFARYDWGVNRRRNRTASGGMDAGCDGCPVC